MNSIQKTLIAALCCTMALNAQAQERTFQRNKVLVEKHTGQGCQACPAAEGTLTKHLEKYNNTDNVVIMRHHSFSTYGAPMIYIQFAKELAGTWGISAWPKLMVDRYNFASSEELRKDRSYINYDASVLNSYNAVQRRMETPTYVSLSFDGSSFDPATGKLRVVLSGEVTKSLPFLRIHAFLTQSGIKGTQSNGGDNYIHDDASRAFLMKNLDGDALTPNTDGTYSVTFETTLAAKYGAIPTVAEDMKLVVFVSSYIDESVGYNDLDYSTSEVHNADVVALLDLPSVSPCATPSITYVGNSFVCKSSTPGAVCHYDVEPCLQLTEKSSGSFDLNAPAFTVTAYADATGFARSAKVSRTFSLRDILGEETSNVRDVNDDGRVNKDDIDALVNKILKK